MLKYRQINIPRKEKFLVMIPREELKHVLEVGLNSAPNAECTIIHPDNYGYVSTLLNDHEHVAVLLVDKLDANQFRTKVRTMNPTAWRIELRTDGHIQYMGKIAAKQIQLHSVVSGGETIDKQWTGLK